MKEYDNKHPPDGADDDDNQSEKSERFLQLVSKTKSRSELLNRIKYPRITFPEESHTAYPGNLTDEQIEECDKFLIHLAKLPQRISEQIYSYRDVEDPEYTICRWVRAMKFDSEGILQRCYDNQSLYDTAKRHKFYPNVSKDSIGIDSGASYSVFLSQYPFLPIGRSIQGYPVNYFQAGQINSEGILCITTIEHLIGYFWWSFMYKMKKEVVEQRLKDKNFVRCEGVNVIDLHGISIQQILSSESQQVLQLAGKIADFFPEVRSRS